MKRTTSIILFVCLVFCQLGCIARLLLVEQVEFAALRRGALGGLAESRSMASLARMGITAEEIATISRSTAMIRSGRIVAAEEVAFNSQLGKIRMIRGGSGNPQLILRGAAEPFAEVVPSERIVRLFSGRTIKLHSDLFSVESEMLIVRRSPSLSQSNNVVATLRKGDLLVRLSERDGWYQVRIVQNGQELTGFATGLILPLVVGSSDDEERRERTPQQAIAHETQRRWDFYWRTMTSVSDSVSATDAMALLYEDFGLTTPSRKVANNEDDWPQSVQSFVRADAAHVPILSSKDFSDPNLRILGFTVLGEYLQFIAEENEGTKFHNPLDWGPKNYGEWYRVKMLSGQEAWFFTQPDGQRFPTGTFIKRCLPGSLVFRNKTQYDFRVFVDGKVIANLGGATVHRIGNISVGLHSVRVLQISGYWFWATDKMSNFQVNCGGTISIPFPW